MTTKKGSVLWKILISLLLLIIILAIVAELGLRFIVGKQLRESYAATVQESGAVARQDPKISFGAMPLLASLVTKNVPTVDLDTPSSLKIDYPGGADSVPEIKGTPAAVINIKDLDISNSDAPVAKEMVVTTDLPADYLLAQLRAGLAEQKPNTGNILTDMMVNQVMQVSDLTTDPANGTVRVKLAKGGVDLVLRPSAENGKAKFVADEASLMGFDLPSQATDSITKSLNDSASKMDEEFTIEDIKVEESAVKLKIKGLNVNMNEVSY